MKLNQIINFYLKQPSKKIIFSDNESSYSVEEFKKKIFHYMSEISRVKTKLNLKKNDSIGFAILLERGVDYFCIIFATWLSGCYYLPLSTNTKKENLRYQIKLSNIAFTFERKNSLIFLRKNNLFKKNKKLFKSKEKIAYIMFTSGSSGKKKGVAISRHNLENYFDSIKKITKKTFYKSILVTGELIFDITIGDIVFALIKKAKIIVTDSTSNLISLFNLMNLHKPEAIYAVPTTWRKIIDIGKKLSKHSFKFVKQINSGGEALHKSLVKDLFKFFPKSKILNLYGPTEFTVNVTHFYVTKKNYINYDIMPIGKKLKNVNLLIKRDKIKAQGELLISGRQQMIGYLNNVKVPTKKINKKRYYPSGDLVFLDKNKNINYINRISDYQKISGYRVDLTSLENLLKNKIKTELCLVVKSNKIYLFILHNKKNKKTLLSDLNKVFLKFFEIYEIPKFVFFLKNLPINTSGKLDKEFLIKKIK